MTALGAFRDDVYNAVNVLTNAQVIQTAQASGVLLATALSSAVENYIVSTVATALTTDTAANIVANLQQAVAVAYKAQLQSFGAGVNPPIGVPNLFNMSFFVQIANTAATLTLSPGTGVTLVGVATILSGATRGWSVTVTSPTTVTFSTLGGTAAASFVV
jgi:hypothetical protein